MPTFQQQFPDNGSTAQRLARAVVHRLQSAGFTAYWAGGCVRDLLRGAAPHDYDVATSAVPDDVMRLFPRSNAVGKAFGVVRISHEGAEFEVATFRTDSDYTDGRRPRSVCFSDPLHDAQRRDFTINAMFYDPSAGCVHDLVNGIEDLRAGIIRCVGDPVQRMEEDYLRMLRAARFAGTFDFTIEPGTANAIRANAARITSISPERVRDEFTRLLLESRQPGQALRTLDALGLLEPLLPEIAVLKKQDQPPEFHPEGTVWEHTLLMLDAMTIRTPELALAVLLHDVGKPPTATFDGKRLRFNRHAEIGATLAETILRRLRFSNDTTAAVATAVRNHMKPIDAERMRQATLRQWVATPTFATELELHRLDCASSHGKLNNYEFLLNFRNQQAADAQLPPPWIRGEDILAMGVPPGPRVGTLLRQAFEAQLDGRFPDRDSLLAWVRDTRHDAPPDTAQ
jgi:poly(A) polymerase